MNYSDKLKSPKWQKKRLEVLQRDSFKCCLCGDEETELHVHHLKYTGPNPENAPNEDLETLCKDCHYLKTFHNDIGLIINAIKINECFIAIVDNGGVALFSINESKLEHIVTFKKNSAVLSELYFQSIK
jgi:hypothetical protein